MAAIFKAYIVPGVETLSTFGLAVTTVFIGTWTSGQELTSGQEFSDLINSFAINFSNWDTPVPYFLLNLTVSILSRLEGFLNRYRYGQLEQKQKTITDLEKQLRAETQSHSESKKSYMSTIENALTYRLTTQTTGFDHRCRVTIYKKQEGVENTLRRIFRHSPNRQFEEEGRISVPMDQGVVGAAWNNHGEKEVEINHDPSSEVFRSKMQSELSPQGCSVPNTQLSMPSKHFFAMKFEDHDSGNRIGIVVFESTELDILSLQGMKDVLSADILNISRLIKHLGVLRAEFNPAPRED